ncbi:MAG: hypothetical protein JWN23_2845 [Rhodocyclales bacterium]|nr:hypothetical protein [Rhodocyclales bacterium]
MKYRLDTYAAICTTCCALLLAAALGACASKGETSSPNTPSASTSSAPATTSKSESSSAASQAKGGIPPGMNAKGEVVDSSKVEGGYGTKITVGEYEGEITGKAAPGSKFAKLKIGMSMKQVFDLIGQPSDQGAYVTGKAFIPFYFGGDRHRFEAVYKNTGRLIFAGGGIGDWGSGHLIWIIHNHNEPAYR